MAFNNNKHSNKKNSTSDFLYLLNKFLSSQRKCGERYIAEKIKQFVKSHLEAVFKKDSLWSFITYQDFWQKFDKIQQKGLEDFFGDRDAILSFDDAETIHEEKSQNKKSLEAGKNNITLLLAFNGLLEGIKKDILTKEGVFALLTKEIFWMIAQGKNKGLGEPVKKHTETPFHYFLNETLGIERGRICYKGKGTLALDAIEKLVNGYIYGIPKERNNGKHINSNIGKASIVGWLFYYLTAKDQFKERASILHTLATLYFRGDIVQGKQRLQPNPTLAVKLLFHACKELGSNKDYNIDTIRKYLCSCIYISSIRAKNYIFSNLSSSFTSELVNKDIISTIEYKAMQNIISSGKLVDNDDIRKIHAEIFNILNNENNQRVFYLKNKDKWNKVDLEKYINFTQLDKVKGKKNVGKKRHRSESKKSVKVNRSSDDRRKINTKTKHEKKLEKTKSADNLLKKLTKNMARELADNFKSPKVYENNLHKDKKSEELIIKTQKEAVHYYKLMKKAKIAIQLKRLFNNVKSNNLNYDLAREICLEIINIYFDGIKLTGIVKKHEKKIISDDMKGKATLDAVNELIDSIHSEEIVSWRNKQTRNYQKTTYAYEQASITFRKNIEEMPKIKDSCESLFNHYRVLANNDNKKVDKLSELTKSLEQPCKRLPQVLNKAKELLIDLNKKYLEIRKLNISQLQDPENNYIVVFINEAEEQLTKFIENLQKFQVPKESSFAYLENFYKKDLQKIFSLLQSVMKLLHADYISLYENNPGIILFKLLREVFYKSDSSESIKNKVMNLDAQFAIAKLPELKVNVLPKIFNRENRKSFYKLRVKEEEYIAKIVAEFAAFFDNDNNRRWAAKNSRIFNDLAAVNIILSLKSFIYFAKGIAFDEEVDWNLGHANLCKEILNNVNKLEKPDKVITWIKRFRNQSCNLNLAKPSHPLLLFYIELYKKYRDVKDGFGSLLMSRCFPDASEMRFGNGLSISNIVKLVREQKHRKEDYLKEAKVQLKAFNKIREHLQEFLNKKKFTQTAGKLGDLTGDKIVCISSHIELISAIFSDYNGIGKKTTEDLIFVDDLVRPVLIYMFNFLLAERTSELRDIIIRLYQHRFSHLDPNNYSFTTLNIQTKSLPKERVPWLENRSLQPSHLKIIGSFQQNLYEQALKKGKEFAKQLQVELIKSTLLPVIRIVYLKLIRFLKVNDQIANGYSGYLDSPICSAYTKMDNNDFAVFFTDDLGVLNNILGYLGKTIEGIKNYEILSTTCRSLLADAKQYHDLIVKEAPFWEKYSTIDLSNESLKYKYYLKLIRLVNSDKITFESKDTRFNNRDWLIKFILKEVDAFNDFNKLSIILGLNPSNDLLQFVNKELKLSKNVEMQKIILQKGLQRRHDERYKNILISRIEKLSKNLKQLTEDDLYLLQEYLFEIAAKLPVGQESIRSWRLFIEVSLLLREQFTKSKDNEILLANFVSSQILNICEGFREKNLNKDSYMILKVALYKKLDELKDKDDKKYKNICDKYITLLLDESIVELFKKDEIKSRAEILVYFSSQLKKTTQEFLTIFDRMNTIRLFLLRKEDLARICRLFSGELCDIVNIKYGDDEEEEEGEVEVQYNEVNKESLIALAHTWHKMVFTKNIKAFMKQLLTIREKYILLQGDEPRANKKLFIGFSGKQLDFYMKNLITRKGVDREKLIDDELCQLKLNYTFQRWLEKIDSFEIRRKLFDNYADKYSMMLKKFMADLKKEKIDNIAKLIVLQFMRQAVDQMKIDAESKTPEYKDQARYKRISYYPELLYLRAKCFMRQKINKNSIEFPFKTLHNAFFNPMPDWNIKIKCLQSVIQLLKRVSKCKVAPSKLAMGIVLSMINTFVNNESASKQLTIEMINKTLCNAVKELTNGFEKHFTKKFTRYECDWNKFVKIFEQYKSKKNVKICGSDLKISKNISSKENELIALYKRMIADFYSGTAHQKPSKNSRKNKRIRYRT